MMGFTFEFLLCYNFNDGGKVPLFPFFYSLQISCETLSTNLFVILGKATVNRQLATCH